jgi:hypothetical protein
VAVRRETAQASSFRCPSAQRSHVGLDPGLIDEDEALRIKAHLPRSPASPSAGHIKAALLKSEQRFFHRSPSRRMNSHTALCETLRH